MIYKYVKSDCHKHCPQKEATVTHTVPRKRRMSHTLYPERSDCHTHCPQKEANVTHTVPRKRRMSHTLSPERSDCHTHCSQKEHSNISVRLLSTFD